MNFEQEGVGAIAEIRSTNKNKKAQEIFVENDKSKVDVFLKEIKCKDNEHLQHIPNKSNERDILYITGASGSGKSYYMNKYIQEYTKKHKKNKVYLFSSIDDDISIKSTTIKRIKLNEGFMNTELTASDFKDSLVLFDDTDVISNKNVLKKVNNILNVILQTGRHFNTSVIYTSHTACNGTLTKVILNEAHSITIFPSGLGGRSMKYLLDSYFGLDKDQIKKIKKLNSRWVTIMKTYPMIVMYEKGAYILNDIMD